MIVEDKNNKFVIIFITAVMIGATFFITYRHRNQLRDYIHEPRVIVQKEFINCEGISYISEAGSVITVNWKENYEYPVKDNLLRIKETEFLEAK